MVHRDPAALKRVDALGNIMNEVTSGDLGIAENARPTDAPVSYPHVSKGEFQRRS